MLTSVNYGHVSELFTIQSVCHVDGGVSSLVESSFQPYDIYRDCPRA